MDFRSPPTACLQPTSPHTDQTPHRIILPYSFESDQREGISQNAADGINNLIGAWCNRFLLKWSQSFGEFLYRNIHSQRSLD